MSDAANPFRATAGLRIDPAPPGSGVRFQLGIEPGALPAAFRNAVEETVRDTLREGLSGWLVTDAVVTLTRSGYTPPPPYGWSKWSTSAADFRHLTPLVLMAALRQAGTQVYEPVHRFSLDIPADTPGQVLPLLARLHAAPGTPRAARFLVPDRGGHPGRPGAPAGPAAACADPRRGRAGLHVQPLPAGARPGSGPAAVRPQPAEPGGVPAVRHAADRRSAPGRRSAPARRSAHGRPWVI